MMEECLTFISRYLREGVSTRLDKRCARKFAMNQAEGESSIFPKGGHPIGRKRKGKGFSLDFQSLKPAHRYILFNCNNATIEQYIKEHKIWVNSQQDRKRKWTSAQSHMNDFIDWFQERVLSEQVEGEVFCFAKAPNPKARREGRLISGVDIGEVSALSHPRHMVKVGADTGKTSSNRTVIGLLGGLHLGYSRHDGAHIERLRGGSFGHLILGNVVVSPRTSRSSWNALRRDGLSVSPIRDIPWGDKDRGNPPTVFTLSGEVPDEVRIYRTISYEERLKHPPGRALEAHFKTLLAYWETNAAKKTSLPNLENREELDNMHTVGPVSFAMRYDKMEPEEPDTLDSIAASLGRLRKKDPSLTAEMIATVLVSTLSSDA
ncbi:hypothetical protein BVRB_5g112000 [Beta vulgaris subsp. vulgaris]|nr:hypothetical protein BVRB_5g112000 [Beta vulgaris subsp. vulgaris]